MSANKPAAILTALLLWSCASSTSTGRSAEELETENVNAVADVSLPTASSMLLAVEVELTASEVRPTGASILFAPPPTGSGSPELRVRANGVEGWEYTIADPLVARVEDPDGGRTIVHESARTHVYAPLSPLVTSITIAPIPDSGTDIRGGTFDVRRLAAEACSRMRSSIAGCREIEARFEPR